MQCNALIVHSTIKGDLSLRIQSPITVDEQVTVSTILKASVRKKKERLRRG